MQTINRKTASTHPSGKTLVDDTLLAELNYRVRHLWSTRLDAPSDIRSDLLSRLCDLDRTIERLSIRSATDSLAPDDHQQLQTCRSQLANLEQGWKSASGTQAGGWH